MMAALAALAAAGCSTGFEDPTIAIDLRVLAIEADHPELVLDFDPEDPIGLALQLQDNPITLRVLVVDPGAARRLEWDMIACPPDGSLRCQPEEPQNAIGAGIVEDPEVAFDPPTGTYVVGLDVLEASVRADNLAGFGGVVVQVQLRIWPEGADPATAIYASKRLVIAPREPAERVANVNPTMAAVTIDADPAAMLAPGRCADPATLPLVVTPAQRIELLPVEPEGVRETYVLPTFDGDVRTITENLRYSFFATAGGWTSGQTGGPIDAFGNVPTLESTWAAPQDAGDVSLWIVQRDERGGLSWQEFCVRVAI